MSDAEAEIKSSWESNISIDFVILGRAFYLLAALAILIVRFIPPLRNRFLDYGARSKYTQGSRATHTSSTAVGQLLDFVAQCKVSHARFSDFYVFLFLCIAFWLSQFCAIGSYVGSMYLPFEPIAYPVPSPRVGMSFVVLLIQSLRRLYECIVLSKPSNASMWIGHYLIGLAFYFFISTAVWMEQIHSDYGWCDRREWRSMVGGVSFIDVAALTLFLFASMFQHRCHRYLASLKKYTLPDKFTFSYIVSPHYTAECLIYLSLSVLAAPMGCLFNNTVLCALVFVVVNLGVTADGTKRWMLGKFPENAQHIQQRWKMIPLLF